MDEKKAGIGRGRREKKYDDEEGGGRGVECLLLSAALFLPLYTC